MPTIDRRELAAIFAGGSLGALARVGLFSPRRRVPVVVSVIDTPERTRGWFEVIDEVTSESGLVTSELVPAVSDRAPLAMSTIKLRGGNNFDCKVTGTSRNVTVKVTQKDDQGNLDFKVTSLFSKKTRKTPSRVTDLAERRLRDWRTRGGGDKRKDRR